MVKASREAPPRPGSEKRTGRPTRYTDEMPDALFKAMDEGKSITQFAAMIGVNRSTIYEWAEHHTEFSDALTRGKEAGEAYWETELQDMMYSKDVNAPLVKLYFANRFNWSDKTEVDNKSTDGSMTPRTFGELYGTRDNGES